MRYTLLSLLLIVVYAHNIDGQTNPNQIIKNLEARMFAVELLPANIARKLKIKTCTIISNDDNKGNFYGEINYNKDGFCTNFWQTATSKLGNFALGIFIKRDAKNRVVEIRKTSEFSDTSKLKTLLLMNDSLLFLDSNKDTWNYVHAFEYTAKGNLEAYLLLRVQDSLRLVEEKLYYNSIDSLSKIIRIEHQEYNAPMDSYVDSLVYKNDKVAEKIYYKNKVEAYREIFTYSNDLQLTVKQIRNGKENSRIEYILDKNGNLKTKTTVLASLKDLEEKIAYTYVNNQLKRVAEPSSTKTIFYTPKGRIKKILFKEGQNKHLVRKWKYKKQLPIFYYYSIVDKESREKSSKVRKYTYTFF